MQPSHANGRKNIEQAKVVEKSAQLLGTLAQAGKSGTQSPKAAGMRRGGAVARGQAAPRTRGGGGGLGDKGRGGAPCLLVGLAPFGW